MNFKIFEDITIPLNDPLTIFMGKNNSGKSTILAALANILGTGQITPPILNKFVDQSNKVTIELKLKLTAKEWTDLFRISKYPVEDNSDLQPIIPELETSVIIIRRITTFVDGKETNSAWSNELSENGENNDVNAKIGAAINELRGNTLRQFVNISYLSTERNFQQTEPYISLDKLIGNEQRNQYIRSILFHLKENHKDEFIKLANQIQAIFPEIDDIDIKLNHGSGIFEFKISINGQNSDINEMGSGTKSLVLILSLILFPNTKIAILDEPDINFHDELVAKFAKFLKNTSSKIQIIIASHHPTFINEFNTDIILHVKATENSADKIKSIVEKNPASEILEDLGIPQGNFERARISESKIIILTEGPTDEKLIEAFASKLGKSEELGRLSPIFHSREGKKKLEYDILDKINGSPVPFLLIYDKDEMAQSEVEKKKEELKDRIYILNRREIENYCLDYETLFEFVKGFEDKKSDEIKEKIKNLELNDFKKQIFTLSEELKQKTILMGFRDKIKEFRLINRNESHDFIKRNRNKTSIEAVDDIFNNFFTKFSNIKHEDLRKIISEEEERISSHWNESELFQICPGKDLKILINQWLQKEFKINFSTLQMIKILKTVDKDMNDLIDRIISIGTSNEETKKD